MGGDTPPGDGESCCEYDPAEGLVATEQELANELAQAGCPLGQLFAMPYEVLSSEATCAPTASGYLDENQEPGVCDAPAELSVDAYEADYALDVDPLDSYVTISSSSQGLATSYMSGTGGAALGPRRFIRAAMVGTDITLESGTYTQISLGLYGDALVIPNGTDFTLPSGQITDIVVYADGPGGPVAWDVEGAGTPATGYVKPGQGIWALDYAGTAGGVSVTIHLEGDVATIN